MFAFLPKLFNKSRCLSIISCLRMAFQFLKFFFHSFLLPVDPCVLVTLSPSFGWTDQSTCSSIIYRVMPTRPSANSINYILIDDSTFLTKCTTKQSQLNQIILYFISIFSNAIHLNFESWFSRRTIPYPRIFSGTQTSSVILLSFAIVSNKYKLLKNQ